MRLAMDDFKINNTGVGIFSKLMDS